MNDDVIGRCIAVGCSAARCTELLRDSGMDHAAGPLNLANESDPVGQKSLN